MNGAEDRTAEEASPDVQAELLRALVEKEEELDRVRQTSLRAEAEHAQVLQLEQRVRAKDLEVEHLEGTARWGRNELRARVAEVETLRRELQAVKEHEARLIAEAHAREEQLIDLAKARESQIVRAAQEREETISLDARDATGQIEALTRVQAEAREREARLSRELSGAVRRAADLEAELVRGRAQPGQIEGLRHDLRRARAELEVAVERAEGAEARIHELHAVVESLGRERAALRSEAGALRARVELLALIEDRARRLAQELEQARRDNAFYNHAKGS